MKLPAPMLNTDTRMEANAVGRHLRVAALFLFCFSLLAFTLLVRDKAHQHYLDKHTIEVYDVRFIPAKRNEYSFCRTIHNPRKARQCAQRVRRDF